MSGGKLTLRYGSTTIDFGIVEKVRPNYSKSCMVVPLPSLPMESTFAVESNSSETLEFSFTRTGSDNAIWYDSLTQAVNRWQCRTNGFLLNYIPDDDNPYIPELRDVRGYVKSLSRTYNEGTNETISGTMTFQTGTMYVSNTSVPSGANGTLQSDFSIFIYDGEGNPHCVMGTSENGESVNCVKSYTLTGGLEQPFEYLTMKIPKQRLSSVAPALVQDGGIVMGVSRVTLHAIGDSEMTVTKCRLSDNTYTITAYANSERLRGYSLSASQGGSHTPSNWIEMILTRGQYGVSYTGDRFKAYYSAEDERSITFSAGTNVWYILQVCAMMLGARIFFADGNVYIVDYRVDNSILNHVTGGIDLYDDPRFENAVVDQVDLGDEGTDTIVNKQTIRYTSIIASEDPSQEATTEAIQNSWTDDESIDVFDEREGNILYIPELTYSEETIPPEPDPETGEIPEGAEPTVEVTDMAESWAKNFISYRSEPQQSVSFSLKEMTEYNGAPLWRPTFDPCTRVDSITDDVNDINISNESDIPGRGQVLQKLTLSTFERRYPEGITTYTWGIMANIDLSTSTSQINTSLNSS